ncbi:MAG: hypothetical protein GX458_01360 [Phyllobacteriaceae bacterium]|nr:hypothetical protein [Phyllobacteriaceae bacterium]
MSEFVHEVRPSRSSAGGVERVFEELAAALERAAFLYGNAAYFDLERARRSRRDFDVAVAKAESFLRRESDGAPAASSAGGPNRAQRIEAEILDFILEMAKPVTIDEVLEHLNGCSLGEPRASLITRMSRMAAAGKLLRSGRGYYELGGEAEAAD